jgi:hypothetical protein
MVALNSFKPSIGHATIIEREPVCGGLLPSVEAIAAAQGVIQTQKIHDRKTLAIEQGQE